MQQLLCIENIYHLHFLDLLLLVCFLSSLENQHVQSLLYDTCNTLIVLSQKKSLRFIDVSKLYWYFERSDSLTTLFASL